MIITLHYFKTDQSTKAKRTHAVIHARQTCKIPNQWGKERRALLAIKFQRTRGLGLWWLGLQLSTFPCSHFFVMIVDKARIKELSDKIGNGRRVEDGCKRTPMIFWFDTSKIINIDNDIERWEI
jgi:hypothetical protein